MSTSIEKSCRLLSLTPHSLSVSLLFIQCIQYYMMMMMMAIAFDWIQLCIINNTDDHRTQCFHVFVINTVNWLNWVKIYFCFVFTSLRVNISVVYLLSASAICHTKTKELTRRRTTNKKARTKKINRNPKNFYCEHLITQLIILFINLVNKRKMCIITRRR